MIATWIRRLLAPRTTAEKFRWLASHAAAARPSQNSGQRLVHDVWWLLAETANGSLSQYVTNSTGDDYEEMLAHLEEIGAREVRKILLELRAIAFVGQPVPRDREHRTSVFVAWEEQPENEQLVVSLTTKLRSIEDQLVADVVKWSEENRQYFPGYPA